MAVTKYFSWKKTCTSITSQLLHIHLFQPQRIQSYSFQMFCGVTDTTLSTHSNYKMVFHLDEILYANATYRNADDTEKKEGPSKVLSLKSWRLHGRSIATENFPSMRWRKQHQKHKSTLEIEFYTTELALPTKKPTHTRVYIYEEDTVIFPSLFRCM